MSLSEYKVVAGLAVSDMDRAREFYEGKLGLSVGIDSDDNVAYRCAEGSVLHVFLSRSTQASRGRPWPRRRQANSAQRYSPECVEGVFSAVRMPCSPVGTSSLK